MSVAMEHLTDSDPPECPSLPLCQIVVHNSLFAVVVHSAGTGRALAAVRKGRRRVSGREVAVKRAADRQSAARAAGLAATTGDWDCV